MNDDENSAKTWSVFELSIDFIAQVFRSVLFALMEPTPISRVLVFIQVPT